MPLTKRLYVGYLPFSATEEQLRALLAPLGESTSAKVISDKFTGQSKRFGFVVMSSDADAAAAISRLHESAVGARKIVVNEARPMERREGGGGGGGHRDRGPR